MKSSKKTYKIILVSLALLIAATGLSYAWFAGALSFDILGDGKAARIRLATPEPWEQEKFMFAAALPGEEILTEGVKLWYDGNRDAIIRISLGDVVAHLGDEWYPGQGTVTPGEPGPWQFTGEYVKDGVRYKYTEERLKEILEFKLNELDDWLEKWHYGEKTKAYYIWVKGDGSDSSKNLLESFEIKFSGEFGGLFIKKDDQGNPLPGAVPSISRQWEQESVFSLIGLKAEVIQVTSEAIWDHWGQDSLDDVKAMKTFPKFSLLEDWTYVG